MDHRSTQRRKESSRWWRREKAYRYLRPAACDLVSMGRAHRPAGNGEFGERINVSRKTLDDIYVTDCPIGESSIAPDFNRNLSKTSSGKPMKVVEEMQKEKESRHSSPSVIARLMGLDALPPQVVHNKPREMRCYFQKTSGLHDKHVFHDYYSSGKARNDYQEVKDVFEIMETSKVEKKGSKTATEGLENSKGTDADIEFIRQKFTDAKDFSTDEIIDDSEVLNDVSEVLDHDKDFFLKFLQEPNSLFPKNFQDVKSIPSKHPSDVTILKSSMATKLKGCELSNKSGRRAERCTPVQKDWSTRKPANVEHSLPLSQKLSKSQYADKIGACINPTEIVILKPSLEKEEKIDKRILLSGSSGSSISHDQSHVEFRSSRTKNLNAEGRNRRKFNDVGTTENKVKGSSEMGRNISKVMGNDASRDIERILASRFNKYISGDSTDYMSQMTYHKNYKRAQRSSIDFTDQYKHHKTASELSVNREGRRRLSQRWKIAHQFGEIALGDRGSNTLAEILSLSNKEMLKTITGSSITRKISGEKSARDGMLPELGCSLTSSNRATWKDACNFPISTYSASSSITLRNMKVNRRGKPGAYDNYSTLNNVHGLGTCNPIDEKLYQRGRFTFRKSKCCSTVSCSCNSSKPEYKLASWDAHVNSEISNKFNLNNLLEGNSLLPDDVISHKDQLLDNRDPNLHLVTCVDQESQIGHSLVGNLHPCYYDRLHSGSPVILKELEHASPVSVLESASEGENYTSGCFEGVNADLLGLRSQLQLLKLESEDVEESGVLVLSNVDTEGVHCSSISLGGMLEELKDAEDREFSYLVDVLIDSGIGGASCDRIFDACYSPEYPVCPDVFEKLEKKYRVLVEWSSSERKLLFDIINIVLMELLAPCMDLHPWVKSKKMFGPMCARERLVEETWHMIARLRKELSRGNPEDKVLDPMWFDIGDDVDIIGREIEGMLKEHLLQELVTDFI
ncbi:hypothetical protein J5N97_006084 [Dioscorea zingiberensis]|uniref:DUF4378 domain-containing protein n=1 Tax=Dioscorea zingiberensis TaxID=325984 RepID=A0A9D5DBB7_9LILI|nr:hypothetical protein J5N97_006084 [Dioscorea zingiberensis]